MDTLSSVYATTIRQKSSYFEGHIYDVFWRLSIRPNTAATNIANSVKVSYIPLVFANEPLTKEEVKKNMLTYDIHKQTMTCGRSQIDVTSPSAKHHQDHPLSAEIQQIKTYLTDKGFVLNSSHNKTSKKDTYSLSIK